MAEAPTKGKAPLVLICGEDEFAVKERARHVFEQWASEIGGMDHERIDGAVTNSGEALKAIRRVREGLNTLPFFGSGKVVWLQNCSFMGDERHASAQAVTEALSDMAEELKAFDWKGVRLLVSAGKVDKRKALYKTFDKLGGVEVFPGLSVDDRDWAEQAERWGRQALRARGKDIGDDALAQLVSSVGPNTRLLDSEAEKLALYSGERKTVELEDVAAICVRNKSARAFALGDALGNRDLVLLLRRLDEELWEVKLDPQKTEIGLLYGLISKVRAMILLKEMLREGWIKADSDYNRFKAQLGRIPVERLPSDKRFNPLAINPYVLFKALPQAAKYSQEELVKAMELLLECNQRLVSTGADAARLLPQTLVQIAAPESGAQAPVRHHFSRP